MEIEDSTMHNGEVDKQFLAAPVKSPVDKFQLIPEVWKARGLHLESFNYFVTTDIKKIVRANSLVTSEYNPEIYLRYKDVRIGRPSEIIDGVTEPLTPYKCRQSDKTYAAPIFVDIEYRNADSSYMENRKAGSSFIENRKAGFSLNKSNVIIGRMPIMLKSQSCVLHGKDEDELAKFGECPLDPGGYFVVKGNEKVILIQEQLSKNRIIIDKDNKGCIQASVMSSCNITKKISKTIIKMEKGKIYLVLNSFSTKVPIMLVLKAMGMQSDQEVVQMLGRDPQYANLLLPSIEESDQTLQKVKNDGASNGVSYQQQALDYLQQKRKYKSAKDDGALGVLRDTFLLNVPVRENNFHLKCVYVVVMLRRMMDAILNEDAMDDKDYVGNKRLELSGQLISILFEDLFKSLNENIRKQVDGDLKNGKRVDISMILAGGCKQLITTGLERSLSTGNWDVRRFKMHRKGITQIVSRLSFINAFGSMTKIQPQFEKSRKVSGPRALQPSQWGMLCPCDTPEGEACGLVKNLALMTHVTTDEETGPIISLCYCLGVDLSLLSGEELHSPRSFLIMLNGLILGKHTKPQWFADSMRKLRRAGKLSDFVSIYVNEKHRCVYIASDGGRVCRPLVIADNGVSRIKHQHMKELKDGARNFNGFLREGLIEYLDVNEENNSLIALYEGETTRETTHIEIEPFTILSACAGLIPYPHHNQSPRNTYQCAMGKQAMGNIAYNQLSRLDSLIYLLVYPQRPLLTTRTIELIGYDKLGAGQNATVAVMSYSGYDIEDAIVMNKASLDRGFGRCIVLKRMLEQYKSYKNTSVRERICAPRRSQRDSDKMQILDNDGIASPGEILRPQDIYLQKECPVDPNTTSHPSQIQYRTRNESYKGAGGEPVVVDRVALCSDNDRNLTVKFMIRHTRRPEVGDKFSSRHGQKGVCGTIVQQEDLPFSERGVCPDLIMNPHGFPSRMTVGKMLELLGSKAAVSCGKFHYGSAFGEPSGHAHKVEDISETLVKHGFCYDGKDFLYSGTTGTPLQAYIFMGPIYYQKLKHMVFDKMHARGIGPKTQLTRQPTEGRAKNGGLRVGEMERDCLIAYGASNLAYERLMLSSDPFNAQVCRKCGLLGYINYQTKTKICSTCKTGDNISDMKLPYACKLLFQELQSMNIVPRLQLNDS
ncbi:putative DNA-directed RNA polymerase [Helianthus annuus]|uniref:DNA-directed RNA polymerase subunit beta n=1 Tax=Helianthus annuus TaxID=4232 RepID=A0A251UK88_HELAN|nr:DNA-directed RNA polymerase III subunit 2 [Helianthus annuus]KAF5764572.1 putative DNA-directed RNA polymerase [Helianthus annuus]KAJ0451229.1 putative DNA-directed RNA polymerase [Helianthus annuus]KAJ0455679.1 putative DNA-directed RNA polymerase [Helianthus annuus]KAJ0473098.1 putative DNA-directed RNA polymerase [Helianthus annuus]KAJ0648701.1 putative DNA-directed RNA polymerase [Helianthus annuus]